MASNGSFLPATQYDGRKEEVFGEGGGSSLPMTDGHFGA